MTSLDSDTIKAQTCFWSISIEIYGLDCHLVNLSKGFTLTPPRVYTIRYSAGCTPRPSSCSLRATSTESSSLLNDSRPQLHLHSRHIIVRQCLQEARCAQRGPLRTGSRLRYLLPARQLPPRSPHAPDRPSSSNIGAQHLCLALLCHQTSPYGALRPLHHNPQPVLRRLRKPNLHGTTSLPSAGRVGGLVKDVLQSAQSE
jgi:hypothetical protein